jgi:hypothetical protein
VTVEEPEGASVLDGLGLLVSVGVPAESGKRDVGDITVRVAGRPSRIGEVVGSSIVDVRLYIGIEVSV